MINTQNLARAVPAEVRDLCQVLHTAGHRAWVVGGCVRDELLAAGNAQAQHLRNDWDIATSATPDQVMKLFRRVIPTGLQHGTVTVLLGKSQYEVTTLRGETTYSDGRRPDSVYFVQDIVEDLARRDFTINAIAYDPLHDRLIDPFSGISDLQAKLLRAVGEPAQRFAEDGLRVLRGARFVATLDVTLEAKTAAAIQPSLNSYRKVSAERIRDEWLKAMKARAPSRAFEIMREHGLLAITAPELLESVGCTQNRFHAFDVWGHALACLDHCPANPVLRISGLLHDIGKPRTRAFSEKTQDYTFYEHERVGAEMVLPLLTRLKFSNEERLRISELVRHHLVCYEPSWSDAAVRRWIKRVSPDLVADLYLLNEADIRGKGRETSADLERLAQLKVHVERVVQHGAALSIRDLAVNGHELMLELQLPPGPQLGEMLKTLLELVIDDPALNHKELLVERARSYLSTPPNPPR